MASSAAPRGEYRKSARRREEILDAAFDVFSRVGFLNASVTQIARAADLTLPGLSHHFRTKEALFSAVIERRDLDAQKLLTERSGVDQLLGLIDIARRDRGDARSTRLYAIISAEATEPSHPMHAYFRNRYDTVIEHVTATFRRAESLGYLRPGIDPAAAAHKYIALSDGLQIQVLYDDGQTDNADLLRSALEEMLTIELAQAGPERSS